MTMAATGRSFDSGLFETALSEDEKILRDLFVNEYLKDFDAYQACIRVGFLSTFALDWARKLMEEGYVQRAIAHFKRTATMGDAEAVATDRALIEATLRQACQHGPYASRVTAARQLAEMRGLAKPDASATAEESLIAVLKGFAQTAPV